jgi:hypothetical protein
MMDNKDNERDNEKISDVEEDETPARYTYVFGVLNLTSNDISYNFDLRIVLILTSRQLILIVRKPQFPTTGIPKQLELILSTRVECKARIQR